MRTCSQALARTPPACATRPVGAPPATPQKPFDAASHAPDRAVDGPQHRPVRVLAAPHAGRRDRGRGDAPEPRRRRGVGGRRCRRTPRPPPPATRSDRPARLRRCRASRPRFRPGPRRHLSAGPAPSFGCSRGGMRGAPSGSPRSPRFALEAWQAVEELGQGRAMTDASPPPSRPMSPRSDPSARSSAHPEPQACSLSAVPFQGNVMATDSPSPAKGLVACPEASRCRRIAPVARHDASDDVKARGWTGTCETMASLARRGTPHSDPGRRSHCDRRPACIQTSDETLSRSQSSTRNHNPRRCP